MWDNGAPEKHLVERNWHPRCDLKPSYLSLLHEPLIVKEIHIPTSEQETIYKHIANRRCLILAFSAMSPKKNQVRYV